MAENEKMVEPGVKSVEVEIHPEAIARVINIRIPGELFDEVREEAREFGRPVQTHLKDMLRDSLDKTIPSIQRVVRSVALELFAQHYQPMHQGGETEEADQQAYADKVADHCWLGAIAFVKREKKP